MRDRIVSGARWPVVLIAAALLLLGSRGARGQEWYSTFEYGGNTYAWSTEYAEEQWIYIVPEASGLVVNDPPAGNTGYKGQAWCEELTGEEGWFLPNLDEAIAGRNSYAGGDPLDMEHPGMCGSIVYSGIPQLWTSTTCNQCDDSGSYHRRAFALHSLRLNVDDSAAQDIACCKNDTDQEHWCCWEKQGYYGHHWCPLARCVRIVDEEPTPTDTLEPTATDTPEPTATNTLEPTATNTLEPTATDTPEPTATDTLEPTATDTVEPTATDTLEPTATEPSSPPETATPPTSPRPTPSPFDVPDVNRDNRLGLGDLLQVLRHLGARAEDAEWAAHQHADVNGDGRVSLADAVRVIRAYFGP